MIQIIILIIGIILTVLMFRRLWIKAHQGESYEDREISGGEWIKMLLVIGLFIASTIVTVMSFTSVDVGHAVLVIDPLSGGISEPHVGAKWFFRMPWTYTVDIYYAMTSTEMWTDNETGERGEFPAIHVLSKDGLDIEVDILIRYQLDPSSLIKIYQSFPDLKWETRAISSIVREDVRDVIAQYTAIELIEERENVSVSMRTTIYDSLISESSLHHALDENTIEIDLRDLDPPQGFKTAIEAKLKAEQEKIQADFERQRLLIQADAEAKQRVILANAIKESIDLIGEENWQMFYSLQMLKELAPYVNTMILTTGDGGLPIYYQLPTNSTNP